MRFADAIWLFGLLVSLVVAGALVWGGLLVLRGLRAFGDAEPVRSLLSHRAGQRRTAKGTLLVLAVALGFLALAGPEYGRGTRLIPATNLDVVIVLDYSKSMYARDITPSRIDRAKVEVTRLISELPGARFGAVAFAGEPLSFPLTSDGGAIAQFFRQLAPNDMPVGGTAIARALEAGRTLLQHDPLSAKHQKVIILVTDGEDLEGDPVAVAKKAAEDKTVIHVVQIGGRTPEPIPGVNEDGTFAGPRTGSDGKILTTELSAEGEKQLADIAKTANGFVVQSAQGETGLAEVTAAMKRMMTEELSERVETVYADVFFYPLILCLFLLLIDSFIDEAPRSHLKFKPAARAKTDTPATKTDRRPKGNVALSSSLTLLLAAGLALQLPTACKPVEEKLFSRYSPKVDQAIEDLKKKDTDSARDLLNEYLATGKCEKGQIGTPPTLRDKPFASYDLGLALFSVAERFGKRFGDEPTPAPAPAGSAAPPRMPPGASDPSKDANLAQRSQEVDCALQVVRIIAADEELPATLRAQAYFLSGNLEFLRGEYEQAVSGYDECLHLVPGDPTDGGLTVGDDAAYNRAIALRRQEEQEKQKQKEQPDGGTKDKDNKDQQDKDKDKDKDKKDQDQKDKDQQNQDQNKDKDKKDQDQQKQDQQNKDQQKNDQQQPSQDKQDQDKQQAAADKAQQGPSLSQDERMLDQLEQAPTVQQQEAAQQKGHVIQGMEDK
ncbi:MAG TPA: VWA domain-containing protein [Polyangiaceae bacterium]|nr:VWA domain-containing protein [Polyangiaceae bacterium]